MLSSNGVCVGSIPVVNAFVLEGVRVVKGGQCQVPGRLEDEFLAGHLIVDANVNLVPLGAPQELHGDTAGSASSELAPSDPGLFHPVSGRDVHGRYRSCRRRSRLASWTIPSLIPKLSRPRP